MNILARLTLAIIMATSAAAAQSQNPNDAPPPEPFTRVCGNCHSPERIVTTRRTRDQWQEVMENMMSRGAQATDDDQVAVMAYLVTRYGRVLINRAAPDDIVEVLAISKDDAQKIVDYRKAHGGKFEDFDALTKVPGIDVETIKAKREAITF